MPPVVPGAHQAGDQVIRDGSLLLQQPAQHLLAIERHIPDVMAEARQFAVAHRCSFGPQGGCGTPGIMYREERITIAMVDPDRQLPQPLRQPAVGIFYLRRHNRLAGGNGRRGPHQTAHDQQLKHLRNSILNMDVGAELYLADMKEQSTTDILHRHLQ